MRNLLLISMMVVAWCYLYSGNESFAGQRIKLIRSGIGYAADENWPVLKRYDQDHLGRIALPLGGIGKGAPLTLHLHSVKVTVDG